jgi:hypothetical protein
VLDPCEREQSLQEKAYIQKRAGMYKMNNEMTGCEVVDVGSVEPDWQLGYDDGINDRPIRQFGIRLDCYASGYKRGAEMRRDNCKTKKRVS